MAAPVNAPAAAPAAAPRDAPRTWPVAAPPMIAPVAAPHAAPWPTGVSHELRRHDVKTVTQAIRKMLVLMLQLSFHLKPQAPARGCGVHLNSGACRRLLGVNKDFVYFDI